MTLARRALGLCAACLVLPALPAHAADPALIAAAQKEGRVTWYTVQIVNQLAAPVAQAFEKKYGIKVEYVRANSPDVVLRVENEAKAGKMHADVVDGDSTAPPLERAGLLLQWLPDVGSQFPAERKDPNGYWIATYISIATPDVNTDQVAENVRPKNWDDLLDPRWKGKIAWASEASPIAGAGFVGLLLDEWGDEKARAYLAALAKQDIVSLPVANRQVLDQVIAGEYAIGLQISNHHALFSAAQGAPVAWLPFSPAMVTAVTASVVKSAPHPAAAKLLLDFLVSKEGQDIYAQNGYAPANPISPPKDPTLVPDGKTFRGVFFSPEDIERETPHWASVFNQYFR